MVSEQMSVTGRLRWLRKRVEVRGTGEESTDALVSEVLGVVQESHQCSRRIFDKLEHLEAMVGAWVVEDLVGRIERVDAKVDWLYKMAGIDEDGFLVSGD